MQPENKKSKLPASFKINLLFYCHGREQVIIRNRKKLVNAMPSVGICRFLFPVWRGFGSAHLLAFSKRRFIMGEY